MLFSFTFFQQNFIFFQPTWFHNFSSFNNSVFNLFWCRWRNTQKIQILRAFCMSELSVLNEDDEEYHEYKMRHHTSAGNIYQLCWRWLFRRSNQFYFHCKNSRIIFKSFDNNTEHSRWTVSSRTSAYVSSGDAYCGIVDTQVNINFPSSLTYCSVMRNDRYFVEDSLLFMRLSLCIFLLYSVLVKLYGT